MTDEWVVTLVSQEGDKFQVPVKAIKMSVTINDLLQDVVDDVSIPLPNIPSDVLRKILEYCVHHADHPNDVVEIKNNGKRKYSEWDLNFCEPFDEALIYRILEAVNYLAMQDLLELLCHKVAYYYTHMDPDKLKELFEDMPMPTPEEEEEILKENPWYTEK